MSSSYQNYIFKVLTKTNNSQTLVQTNKEKSGSSYLSWEIFSDALSVEALRLFQGEVKFFSSFCNIFPVFCPKPPCFSMFSRSGPVFPGFPGAVGTLFFVGFVLLQQKQGFQPCDHHWFQTVFMCRCVSLECCGCGCNEPTARTFLSLELVGQRGTWTHSYVHWRNERRPASECHSGQGRQDSAKLCENKIVHWAIAVGRTPNLVPTSEININLTTHTLQVKHTYEVASEELGGHSITALRRRLKRRTRFGLCQWTRHSFWVISSRPRIGLMRKRNTSFASGWGFVEEKLHWKAQHMYRKTQMHFVAVKEQNTHWPDPSKRGQKIHTPKIWYFSQSGFPSSATPKRRWKTLFLVLRKKESM